MASDPFNLDIRVAKTGTAATPDGFLSFGSTCWSCEYTCYTSQDCGDSASKFCSLACSESGCCDQE